MSGVITADVAVLGGGLGGVAAALAAADAGCTVLLTEGTDRLGGQVTSQGVSALDEHPHIEHSGRTERYARFRALVREAYTRRGAPARMADGAPLNPGNGWVSRLCFEPAAGLAALRTMLAPHVAAGRVQVLLRTQPTAVDVAGDRIAAARLAGPEGDVTIRAPVWLDATELGDLIALAGAPWVTGAEAGADTGEPDAPQVADPEAVQACTACFVVEWRAGEQHVTPRPEGYEHLRDTQPFTLGQYRMRAVGPTGLPPFWTYRRLRDAALVGPPELALINWPGNDYRGRVLFGEPPGPDPAAVAEAKRLSLAFLHWLQTEAPRDDGGCGYPELRLAPEVMGTGDGLAAHPYVREGRRLRAQRRVTAQDLLPRADGGARARRMDDSVGVGWYALDLHRAVGYDTERYDPTLPFQIPLGALVTRAPVNLVASAKNIGVTHLTNGAYRVHPIEWAVGEAAGTLAAHALAAGVPPAAVPGDPRLLRALQWRLVRAGAPIWWCTDLPAQHPAFPAAQLLAAAGATDADPRRWTTLDLLPDAAVTPAERDALLATAHAITGEVPDPNAGATWGDACLRLAPALEAALGTARQALAGRRGG